MEDLEKVYDEEISPLMQQIIEICKQHKIPMFAEFQYSNENFCKTLMKQDGHSLFNHFDALVQCVEGGGINIDKYMFWVMRGAREAGHSSVILSQLGIPLQPEIQE